MATKFLPFYNVDASVGKGGANQYDDVLLVQYMLSGIGRVPPHPLPPPTTPLSVDGTPSPLLNEWILWFQKSCKAKAQNVMVDGRIDPSRSANGSFYPPSHGHTMGLLNITYRRRFRASHDAMERDQQCPMPLRTKFALYDDFPT
jgi:hypothetical protein